MANDRVYAECLRCKERKLVFKYYPSKQKEDGLSSYCYRIEELADFLIHHLEECHPSFREMHLNGNPGFRFVCEDDPVCLSKHGILNTIADGLCSKRTKK
jgi:hypothetical protein